MAQWLGFWAFTAVAWVQSTVRELRSRNHEAQPAPPPPLEKNKKPGE